MKKNFAAQPSGGGQIVTLTGLDLTSEVNSDQNIFQKSPNFIDNCKDCGMKKNFDDSGYGYGYDYSGSGMSTTTTATPKKMPPSMDKQIKLESEAKFWTKRLFKKRKKI